MMLKHFASWLSRSRRWLHLLISIVTALGLVIGQPVISQAIPWRDLIFRGIQVIQLSSLSPQQEVEIGRQINQQLIARNQIKILQNPAINQFVNQIGQQLVAQSNRAGIPYTFQVVDDRSVNAFATMGGFVYVNRGLLLLASNEAELASVMAHEIGHITGRHAVEQMRKTAIASGLVGAAGLDRNVAANIGVELALRRPNSRKDELEADSFGLDTLRQAGYSQRAMISFMSKLLQERSVPTFLSTHPNTADRISRLQQLITSPDLGGGLDGATYQARIRAIS